MSYCFKLLTRALGFWRPGQPVQTSCCSCQSSKGSLIGVGSVVVVSQPSSMLSGRQCAGASTTGRVAREFGDISTHHSHDHSPRLPLRSVRSCARGLANRSLFSSCCRRNNLKFKASLRCRPPGQQRCQQKRHTTCSASDSCNEPSSDRTPGRYQHLRTAAVLSIVFGAWCCVSAHTQTSSAFLSMTTALTGAGASSAGEL